MTGQDVWVDSRSVDDLLRTAIVEGDESSAETFMATGSVAVSRFGDWLDGRLHLDFPNRRDREFIDNTSALSCRLATRFSVEYAAAFADRRWLRNGFVLSGLGYTQRPEALPILIEALFSDAPDVTRLNAARSLRFFSSQESVDALLRAVDDPDYLVQYHAIESLGAVGDRRALDRLLELAADPPGRSITFVAPPAIRAIAKRLGIAVEVPTSDRWNLPRFTIATDDD